MQGWHSEGELTTEQAPRASFGGRRAGLWGVQPLTRPPGVRLPTPDPRPQRETASRPPCACVCREHAGHGCRPGHAGSGREWTRGCAGQRTVEGRGHLGPVSGCSPTEESLPCVTCALRVHGRVRGSSCASRVGCMCMEPCDHTCVCVCTRVCLSGRGDRGHAPSELSRQLPGWDISALTCVDKAGGTPGFLWSGFSKKPSPETPVLQTWHAPALWGLPDGETKVSLMSIRRQTPWRPEPPPCPGLSPRTRCRPAPCRRGRHQGPLEALHGPALCNRSPLWWRPHESRQTRNWSYRNSTLRQEPEMGTHPPSGSIGHGAIPAVCSGSREACTSTRTPRLETCVSKGSPCRRLSNGPRTPT